MPAIESQRQAADFAEYLGYVPTLPEDGVAELSLVLGQHHCNRLGTIHGGVIMTLLDAAGMWACTESGKAPVCATVSLACSFLKAVRRADADVLLARGEVVRKGTRTYFATISVFAGDERVAVAQGVYAAPPPPKDPSIT